MSPGIPARRDGATLRHVVRDSRSSRTSESCHLPVPNRDPESSPPVATSEVSCDGSVQDGTDEVGPPNGAEIVPPWLGSTTCSARGSTASPHQFCQYKLAIAPDPGRMRTFTSTRPGGGAVAITLPTASASCRTGKVISSHADGPLLMRVKSVASTCGGELLLGVTST